MSRAYGIEPKLEHHTCMVVMLGCAGRFEDAMSVMRTMPCCDDPSAWLALLSTCKKWGNVELGRLAFDEIMEYADAAEGPPPAAYILMAGIYTAAGMPEDAEMIDALKSGKQPPKCRRGSMKEMGI
jgi:pentatricopeptide repeat protein